MVKVIDGVTMVDLDSIKAAAYDNIIKNRRRESRKSTFLGIVLLLEGVAIGTYFTKERFKRKEEKNGN